MNSMDHKGFVELLREEASFQRSRFHRDLIATEMESAANAIETLLAERDAAVEDLHRLHTICMDIGGSCPECGDQINELLDAACVFCWNGGFGCWVDDPKEESRCAAFKWRGPRKPERSSPDG